MEPFFWPSTREKLPGKHGQQDLIAAPAAPGQTSKPFQNKHFPTWHGFRSVVLRTAAWESLGGSQGDPQTSLGGLWFADHSRGEPPMENTLPPGLSRARE